MPDSTPIFTTSVSLPTPRSPRTKSGATRRAERQIPLAPDDPACWAWPPYRVYDGMTAKKQIGLLRAWHKGRCGICSRDDQELVTDHSHRTAKVRGLLCQDCNLTEGKDRRPEGVFARWRACASAQVLGLDVVYVNPVSGEVAEPMTDKVLGPEYLPDWAPRRDRRKPRLSPASAGEPTTVTPVLRYPVVDFEQLRHDVRKLLRHHVPGLPEHEVEAVTGGVLCVANDHLERRRNEGGR